MENKLYIFMDAQEPTDYYEATLEDISVSIAEMFNDDTVWSEIENGLTFERLEELAIGIDYRIFNNMDELKDWYEELQLEFMEV